MDDKKLRTGLTILTFAICIIGLILSIRIMVGYEDVVGIAITLTMILLAIAAGVAVLFGLLHLVTNIKRNLSLLAGIIGFVVLAVISYLLASDSTAGYDAAITAATSKLSGAGVIFMFIMLIGAVAAAVFGEFSRMFK